MARLATVITIGRPRPGGVVHRLGMNKAGPGWRWRCRRAHPLADWRRSGHAHRGELALDVDELARVQRAPPSDSPSAFDDVRLRRDRVGADHSGRASATALPLDPSICLRIHTSLRASTTSPSPALPPGCLPARFSNPLRGRRLRRPPGRPDLISPAKPPSSTTSATADRRGGAMAICAALHCDDTWGHVRLNSRGRVPDLIPCVDQTQLIKGFLRTDDLLQQGGVLADEGVGTTTGSAWGGWGRIVETAVR